VGALTWVVPETKNAIFRKEPDSTVTAWTAAVIAGAVPEGVRVTVTLAGLMVPDGNPDPVMLTTVTPGSA